MAVCGKSFLTRTSSNGKFKVTIQVSQELISNVLTIEKGVPY